MGNWKRLCKYFRSNGARSSPENATINVSSIEITQESCPNVLIPLEGNVGVKSEIEDHTNGSPSSTTKHMATELMKFNSHVKSISEINQILDFIQKVCFLLTSIYLVHNFKWCFLWRMVGMENTWIGTHKFLLIIKTRHHIKYFRLYFLDFNSSKIILILSIFCSLSMINTNRLKNILQQKKHQNVMMWTCKLLASWFSLNFRNQCLSYIDKPCCLDFLWFDVIAMCMEMHNWTC